MKRCSSKQIEESLKQRILSGQMRPGTKLPSEEGLRKEFCASRTAVREAIRQLQGGGLVATVNGSGSYVSSGQLDHVFSAFSAYSLLIDDRTAIRDLLELRQAIEGAASARVADQKKPTALEALEQRLSAMEQAVLIEEFAIRDIDFHMELLRVSGNQLFAMLGKAMRDRYVRFAIDSYRSDKSMRDSTLLEHKHILNAIKEGKPTAARNAMRRHITQAKLRWERWHSEEADRADIR